MRQGETQPLNCVWVLRSSYEPSTSTVFLNLQNNPVRSVVLERGNDRSKASQPVSGGAFCQAPRPVRLLCVPQALLSAGVPAGQAPGTEAPSSPRLESSSKAGLWVPDLVLGTWPGGGHGRGCLQAQKWAPALQTGHLPQRHSRIPKAFMEC